jgi:hypothetical protein
MRQDTEQYRNGAKSLRNMRCLIGGGVTRRPGTRKQAELTQDALASSSSSTRRRCTIWCFRPVAWTRSCLTALPPDRSPARRGPARSGPRWTGSAERQHDLPRAPGHAGAARCPDRRGNVVADRLHVLRRRGRPHRAALLQGRVDAAMTLAPSALTGSITLTDVRRAVRRRSCRPENPLCRARNPDHWRHRATLQAAPWLRLLPATQTLTVTSSANFAIGEVVLGDTS